VIGIEPIKKLADAGTKNSLKIISCMFDETIYEKLSGEKFDIITFRESIYYMFDVKKTLNIVKKLLKREGLLYIKSHTAESPFYWFNEYNVRYGIGAQGLPRRESLKKILEIEGFKVLGVKKILRHNFFTHVPSMQKIAHYPLLKQAGYFFGYLLALAGREDRFLMIAGYGGNHK